MRNLYYHGRMYNIRVTRTSVRIACISPGREFTLEETDRSSGIQIQGAISVPAGQLVCAEGTLRTASTGERYVELSSLTPFGPSTALPLGVSNRDLGGALGLTTTGGSTVRTLKPRGAADVAMVTVTGA